MAATNYVGFVRKIYDATLTGAGLAKCKQMAEQAGYRYMSFNGDIWHLTDDLVWMELKGMHISDFEC